MGCCLYLINTSCQIVTMLIMNMNHVGKVVRRPRDPTTHFQPSKFSAVIGADMNAVRPKLPPLPPLPIAAVSIQSAGAISDANIAADCLIQYATL